MALPPIMIYGDDVTHILTEEGIANLLLCRSDEEREQAIRGVAGYTPVGLRARRARGREPARPRRDPPRRRPRHRPARRRRATCWPRARSRTWCAPRAACTSRPSASATGKARRHVMEHARAIRFAGGRHAGDARRAGRRGGSGNLEVLIEPARRRRGCAIDVSTSARGFGTIWQAVVADFHARHPLAGVRVSINDMGATPGVVSLRLDQAVEANAGTAMKASIMSRAAMTKRRRASASPASSTPAAFARIAAAGRARRRARTCAQLGVPVAFDDGVVVGRGDARRPARVRRRAGRRLHGRRRRRGARRQARRPARARARGAPARRCCCCSSRAACACTRPMPA